MISRLLRLGLLTLFTISPFLAILSSYLSSKNIPFSELVGGVKDIIVIFIICLSFSAIYKVHKVKRGDLKMVIAFFIFLLYFLLHFIGSTSLPLLLDGVRYQVIYVFLGLSLVIYNHICSKYIDLFPTICKFALYQLLIVLLVAAVEYFEPTVIEVIYGISKENMNNVELAVGVRLISVLANPINLGAFIVFGQLCFFYVAEKRNNPLIWSFFWGCSIVSLLVILFTFSRLALISFSIVNFVFLLRGIFKGRYISSSIIIIGISFLLLSSIGSYDDFDGIIERLSNLGSSKVYSDNARVNNWEYALSRLTSSDPFSVLWGLGAGTSNPTFNSGGIIVENSFISVLVDFGFIGLLIYVFIFLMLFFNVYKLRVNKPEESFLILMFTLFFFTMSMGNDFNRNFPFVYYFWLFFYLSYNERLKKE